MTWKKVTGDFFKFADAGDKLEGIWQGVREGRYGDNGAVMTDDGERLFGITKVLEDLKRFPVGTRVRIVYTGEGESRDGTRFKRFEISVDVDDEATDASILDPALKGGDPAGVTEEEDVPF